MKREFYWINTTEDCGEEVPPGWSEYHLVRMGELQSHWLIKRKRENSLRCDYYHYTRGPEDEVITGDNPFGQVMARSTKLAATNEKDARKLVLAIARLS